MAIVKSKLLKQLSNNYPNFLKKDLEKFTDIILNETNGGVEQVLYPVPINYPPHQKCVKINVYLGMENGNKEAIVRGADLTHEYVTENGDYRNNSKICKSWNKA